MKRWINDDDSTTTSTNTTRNEGGREAGMAVSPWRYDRQYMILIMILNNNDKGNHKYSHNYDNSNNYNNNSAVGSRNDDDNYDFNYSLLVIMKCSLCEQAMWNSLLQSDGFASINVQIRVGVLLIFPLL